MLSNSTRLAILREHRVGFRPYKIAEHFGVSLQQVVEVVHGLDRDPEKVKRKVGRKRKVDPGEVPPLEELSSLALMARGLVMSGEPLNVIYHNFCDAVEMNWLDQWAREAETNGKSKTKKGNAR